MMNIGCINQMIQAIIIKYLILIKFRMLIRQEAGVKKVRIYFKLLIAQKNNMMREI